LWLAGLKSFTGRVYLAIGVSGEQQHMAGITGAKLMVAINNDQASPVFQQVDLGVVEDSQEFLLVMIAKIKAHRQKKLTCQP
jgi:electron transfer flavoprotein alpha subunit